MQSQIYNLTLQKLQDEQYFTEVLCNNLENSYYWSADWSEEFYIKLAQMGFMSTTYDTKEGLVLLPELQFDYGILDFTHLHIGKKVAKLLLKDDCTLCFNTNFDAVIQKFSAQHKYNWFKDEYITLIKKLYVNNQQHENFKIYSVELVSKHNQELIAGEIGYSIGKTYTSLTGFSSKEKKYNNYGKLQLVLLAKHLEREGFSFWNLGHPHMEYKQKLGSVTHTRKEFLKRWQESTKHKTLKL